MPKAHVKVKSWNWDRLITRTDRGFTRNGALMKGTMAGVLTGGLTMGMVLSGVKIVNKHMSLQALFHLKAQNWKNEPGHTRVNALNFGPEGIGSGRFHDWIPDGESWHIKGYDENGFPQVSGWKTHGCIRSVEQQRISLCISTSIKSCGDRV